MPEIRIHCRGGQGVVTAAELLSVAAFFAPTAYAIDVDYCKGCGICATECPAGAVAMEPEQI